MPEPHPTTRTTTVPTTTNQAQPEAQSSRAKVVVGATIALVAVIGCIAWLRHRRGSAQYSPMDNNDMSSTYSTGGFSIDDDDV